MGWAGVEGAGQEMEGAVGGGEELGAVDLPRTESPSRLVVVRSLEPLTSQELEYHAGSGPLGDDWHQVGFGTLPLHRIWYFGRC